MRPLVRLATEKDWRVFGVIARHVLDPNNPFHILVGLVEVLTQGKILMLKEHTLFKDIQKLEWPDDLGRVEVCVNGSPTPVIQICRYDGEISDALYGMPVVLVMTVFEVFAKTNSWAEEEKVLFRAATRQEAEQYARGYNDYAEDEGPPFCEIREVPI